VRERERRKKRALPERYRNWQGEERKKLDGGGEREKSPDTRNSNNRDVYARTHV